MSYDEYLRNWLDSNHKEGDSPLSYEKWCEKNYYNSSPKDEEIEEIKKIYERICEISRELNDIRMLLYKSRAHRMFVDDWEEMDERLYCLQGQLAYGLSEGISTYDLAKGVDEI